MPTIKRKQKQPDATTTEAENLRAQVAKLSAQREEMQKLWMEECEKSQGSIAHAMENQKLQKQLLVIGHITAGRANEAIQEILTPIPVLFNLDIRVSNDDRTRNAFRKEVFEKVKQTITDQLAALTLVEKESSNAQP